MTAAETKHLCLSLMRADSEAEVISLLKDAGYWDNPIAWRFYGDYENNYNTIGNQQGKPDAALVEKLVNSVDARLMNECMARGVAPDGPGAPADIRNAVAWFFEDRRNSTNPTAGKISNWPDSKRKDVAGGITLAATGVSPKVGKPCFTIADCGEGQMPSRMPDTLLSLTRSNKLRIPFVQGKFNMGGTGVLKFCGRHNFELVVTRRNPALTRKESQAVDDMNWGFTVVRRENPEGNKKSSAYSYLAPVGMEQSPNKGTVLNFESPSLPIFPSGRDAYGREAEWGTLIKLYEYTASGYSNTHILRKDGLLARLDLLLPDLALPIRLYECRPMFKGHEGSFETTLMGVGVRLDDDKGSNLEPEFPKACPFSAGGEEMTATIFAFKKDKADTYRKNEGIIFTQNGQTHGHLTPDFFGRKRVGLSYLSDSLMVVVDCSRLSGRAREDLFMNSRDRLSSAELRSEIEQALEDLLKNDENLRDLRNRRREEELKSKLQDSKPLEDILESILKHSPTLASLFLRGQRVSNPFKTTKVKAEKKPYSGKRFPTYFKFKGKDYGAELRRDSPLNSRCRVTFETDVENDYFRRVAEKGEFKLLLISEDSDELAANYVGPNLHDGIATLSVKLPDNCEIGDVIGLRAILTDPSRIEAFENIFYVTITEAVTTRSGVGTRRKPPAEDEGEDREVPSGIAMPIINEVHEKDWDSHKPAFDKYTALRVKHAGSTQSNSDVEQDVYDFYVNMDNVYLKTEMKAVSTEPEVVSARFVYGLVLLALGLLQEDSATGTDENASGKGGIEMKIDFFTRSVATVLLPLIESLGDLEVQEVRAWSGAGESV